MEKLHHRVAGIYAVEQDAQETLQQLETAGLKPEQLHVLIADEAIADAPIPNDPILKEVLVDSAIGTVVGGSVGAIGQIAMAAANVSLFVASPLVAPMALVGWGAAVGLVAGAGAGIAKKRGNFSDFVTDAVAQGYAVLIAYTRNTLETERAKSIIAASGKGAHEMQVVDF